ncbi:LysM peptidoglycan-binding domain-containing protein [Streptomyces sp. NPDC046332]|uniref:transglycosylase SLT domain-containing protein n=1 Tax=unclassified Streptomyces TaxID=2593676 RepID=UPI00340186B6
MPAHGKHRRPKRRPLSRGIALASTGGAALALPLVATAGAHAAPNTAPTVASIEKTTFSSPAKIAESVPAAGNSAAKIYTVVGGDSLSVIAHEQGVRGGWKALYQANRKAVGDNPSLIHPGLELSLSGKPAAAKKQKSSARTTSTDRADRSQERSAAPGAAATKTPAKAAPAKAPAAAPAKAAPAAAKSYTNDLDGWIRESLDVLQKYGIPGTYEGIHRNIMRESSGNPQAINLWDSNAVKGTPSKGLLQVIEPTFLAYHVPGTSMDLFDPVANITAACNYAADRYGSIDNVNGPY